MIAILAYIFSVVEMGFYIWTGSIEHVVWGMFFFIVGSFAGVKNG